MAYNYNLTYNRQKMTGMIRISFLSLCGRIRRNQAQVAYLPPIVYMMADHRNDLTGR